MTTLNYPPLYELNRAQKTMCKDIIRDVMQVVYRRLTRKERYLLLDGIEAVTYILLAHGRINLSQYNYIYRMLERLLEL